MKATIRPRRSAFIAAVYDAVSQRRHARPLSVRLRTIRKTSTRNVGGEYGARVPGLEVLGTTICFACPTAAPMKKIDDTMIVLGGDAVAALFWVAAPGVALALVRSSD
jgi:hypothetical protein